MRHDAHVVITDSGLGGLSVCAALERGLRLAAEPRGVRLTYVNAWPYEDRGYNDLPDEEARARVFDSALARIVCRQCQSPIPVPPMQCPEVASGGAGAGLRFETLIKRPSRAQAIPLRGGGHQLE
jgi:hypothetical protein